MLYKGQMHRTRDCGTLEGIAMPVCALARNDMLGKWLCTFEYKSMEETP